MQKLIHQSHQLIFKNKDTGFTKLGLAIAIPCTLWGLYLVLFKGENFSYERVQGSAGAAITMYLMAFVFYEKGLFIFDKKIRAVRWSRIKFFRQKKGEIKFADIKNIIVQTAMAARMDPPSRRLTLITTGGEIPLTVAYRSNSGYCDQYAKDINDFLNSPRDVFGSDRSEAKKRSVLDFMRVLKKKKDLLQK